MMRIAEAIARQHRAQALVTGEVVGQVASQTLENLASIDSVVTMPVLRPLVGMDKDEITAEAQRLGTYPDLDHPGPGLLHALHAAASGDEGAPRRRRARRSGAPDRRDRRTRRRRGGRGGLSVSCNKMIVYCRAGSVLGSPDVRAVAPFSPGPRTEENDRENHTRQTRGHEGRLERSRRDRGGGDGPARLAEEVARQGKGRRGQRSRDGGVQDRS